MTRQERRGAHAATKASMLSEAIRAWFSDNPNGRVVDAAAAQGVTSQTIRAHLKRLGIASPRERVKEGA